MRSLLLVALFVGLAFASLDTFDNFYNERYPFVKDIKETVFRTDKEYNYWYDGQVLTGIPGSSEDHSGTRLQCLVTLQLRGTTFHMQLKHVRMGKLLLKVPHPRVVLPFEVYDETEIQPTLKTTLEKPVKFVYTNGLVRDITFDVDELPWSANVKRGIMNLLQVNLKETTPSDDQDDRRLTNTVREDKEATFYRTMERTLEGECETMYQLRKVPCFDCKTTTPVLNVTKTINFEKCNKRPQIKYNWHLAQNCPTCDTKYTEDQKYLKSLTVLTYNITGTRDTFMIESAKTESQYTVVMYNEDSSVVNTYVNQTMVLIKSGPITTQIPELRSPVASDSHLMYTLEADAQMEKFFMDGDETFHQKNPYSDMPNKLATIEDLLVKLVRHMNEEVDVYAPTMFSRLVTVLRVMKKTDLERVFEQFYKGSIQALNQEEKKKVKDVLMNAFALAGTHPSIEVLTKKIETGDLTTFETVNALRQLMLTRVVSEKMINLVKSVCKSPVSRNNFAIYQTCTLTLGSMMHTLCDVTAKEWAVEMKPTVDVTCTRELKTTFVDYFMTQFRETEEWERKIVSLKALGNTGIDMAIFELQKIIQNVDKVYPIMIRTQAIDSLRTLVDQMPKKVQKILTPIYMDVTEHPTVRMVAATFLFKSQPERPLLEMIAKSIDTERSTQVASYVYSMMRNIANTTQPCYKKLATDVKLALRFTRHIRSTFVHSTYNHFPMHSDYLKTGFDLESFKLMSNYSMLPQALATGLNVNAFGFFSQLAKLVVRMDNMEPLIYKVFGPHGFFNERTLSQILRRQTRDVPQGSNYRTEMQEIMRKLKIRERTFTSEPKAYMALTWMNHDVAFVPIDEDLITSFMQEGSVSIRDFETRLREGYNFNVNYATFLTETDYRIPTAMGLPLMVKHQAPMVASLRGNLKLTITPETTFGNIKINTDIQPSVAVKYFQNVELWTPIVNTGLKVNFHTKISTPIKGHLNVDLTNPKKEMKLTIQTPTEARELLTIETAPEVYTFTWPTTVSTWEEPETKTIMGEEINRVKTFNKECCGQSLGLKMQLKGRLHWTPYCPVTGAPMFPLTGPNKLSLIVEPGVERLEEIELKLTTDLGRQLTEALTPSFTDYFFTHDVKEDEKSTETTSFPRVEQRDLKKSEITFEVTKKVGGTTKRFLNTVCTTKYTSKMDYTKMTCKLERVATPEDTEPLEVCTDIEMLYPKEPYRMTEVRGKKMLTKAKVTWGRTCDTNKFVDIKIQGERSLEQARYEERMMEEYQECEKYAKETDTESPMVCHDYLVKASMLKKYKFDIDYKNVPVTVRNITDKLFRWVQHHYYYQTDIANVEVRNPENKIKGELRIDPHTMRRVNMTVKMPTQNVTMIDIPVPVKINPVNVKVSTWDRMMHTMKTSAKCKVHTDRYIETFDKLKFRVPLTTCYTVLAKDCTDEQRFTVLIKKLTTGGDEKEVKILTQTQKIVLRPESNEVKVTLNGHAYPIEETPVVTDHDQDVICEKQGPYIKCTLPEEGIKVYFDGYSCHVKMSTMYMSRQCGLCGHFDYEHKDEFRTPTFENTNDVREFFMAYTITDDTCQVPQDLKTICADEDCEYTPEWRLVKTPEWERSGYKVEKNTDEMTGSYELSKPRRLNKVVERTGQVCFSKEALPVCPTYSYTDRIEDTRDIAYTCLPAENFRTQELLSSAQRFPLDEVKTLPTHFTRTEKVPSICRWI